MKGLGHPWNRETYSLRFLTEAGQQLVATEKVLDIHFLRRNETTNNAWQLQL
jgi:hypothetical protein